MSIEILRPPLARMYLPQMVAIGSVGPSCRKIFMRAANTFSSSAPILRPSIANLYFGSLHKFEGAWLAANPFAVAQHLLSRVKLRTFNRLLSYLNST